MKSRSRVAIFGFEPPEPGGGNACLPATRLPSLRVLGPEPPGCCRYPSDMEITVHGLEAYWVLLAHLDVGLGVHRLPEQPLRLLHDESPQHLE